MGDRGIESSANDGNEDIFAVQVTVTESQVRELLRRGDLYYGDRPHLRRSQSGKSQLDLFISRAQIDELASEGYEVSVSSNQSARLRERIAEVGKGDRFEGGRIPPTGLGRKIGPGDARSQAPPQSPRDESNSGP
jgi:hypothetical protein